MRTFYINQRNNIRWMFTPIIFISCDKTLETRMRAQRENIKLLEEGRADEDSIITARARYRVTSSQYAHFSKAMGLPQQRDRIYKDGKGGIGKGKWKTNTSKTVAKLPKGGIINIKEDKILSSQQVIEKAEQISLNSRYETIKTLQDVRTVTNSILGYDNLPEVLSSDKFKQIAQKDNVLFKEIKSNKNKTADEIIKGLEYGKIWTVNIGGIAYENGIFL